MANRVRVKRPEDGGTPTGSDPAGTPGTRRKVRPVTNRPLRPVHSSLGTSTSYDPNAGPAQRPLGKSATRGVRLRNRVQSGLKAKIEDHTGPPLVEVYWYDAFIEDGWQAASEMDVLLDSDTPGAYTQTVGYLVLENKKRTVLAMAQGHNGEWGEIYVIPTSTIDEIIYLMEAS